MNHVEYFFRPRNERGALDAYGFRCSCGAEQTTSLELEQRQLAAAHLDWHERRAWNERENGPLRGSPAWHVEQNALKAQAQARHAPALIGTKVGAVESGPLTGWAKVSTGDGRYITTKSGVCFGRQHDPTIPTDLAWVAVNAYVIAKAKG